MGGQRASQQLLLMRKKRKIILGLALLTAAILICLYPLISNYTAIKYKWFDDVEKGIIDAIIYIISSETIYEQLKFIYNGQQKYGK